MTQDSTLAPGPASTGSHAGEAQGPNDREMQRAGRGFVLAFYSALRALKLYPLENQAAQNALRELEEAAKELMEREGELVLRYVGDFYFVNDLRLRVDLSSYASFGAVGRVLETHGVGELDVRPGVTRAEWTAFLTLLGDAAAEDPFARFLDRLKRSNVQHIRVAPAASAATDLNQSEQAKQIAKRTYSHTVAVAREVMTGVRMGKAVNLRRVKRSVQTIVDQVLNNESSILGMSVLRDYDQYTFAHSVNVCIFSIAIGKRLGLDKFQLYELGLGALLHDIGKTRLPIELTNKTGALDEPEWALIREHPTEGMLALLEMRDTSDLPLRAMLTAYEHHMKVDLSGYPRSVRPRDPTLFSRIVAVADGFDAATTKRSYQKNPLRPDEVIREMVDNPNRGLDPLVVKAFISMTGIYPVGSVVILDSFELAVVVAPSTRRDALHQPVVRVIFDELGMPVSSPRTLDLTETDPATGAPLRTIIKTTDPERYGINVKDYFV